MLIVVFFLMLANYTAIEQRQVVQKLDKLTNEIFANGSKPANQSQAYLWYRFNSVYQEILDFFDRLHGYNQFWSAYISISFAVFTIHIVYLGYGIIFDFGSFNLLLRYYFINFCVEFLVILLVITRSCSIVVRNSVMIYKNNCRFCFAFQWKFQGHINSVYLAKVRDDELNLLTLIYLECINSDEQNDLQL